jgi:hypothetical protein
MMTDGQLSQDLDNATTNLKSWLSQQYSPFVRTRIRYWQSEVNRLVDFRIALWEAGEL